MTSTATTAAPAGVPPHHHHHHPHDHQSPAEYALPASLMVTRPILPLPKRRIPTTATNPSQSSSSSSSTTAPASSTTIPSTPSHNQIFSHTYPLATSSSSSPIVNRSLLPPYLPVDAQDSESDDDGDDAGSTDSCFGREDLNSNNNKKRKIPLSATSNATLNSTAVDGGGGSSPGPVTRVLSSKTGPSSASSTSRLTGWRVPSATMRSEGGYLRRTKARRSAEPEDMNGVVPGLGSVPSTPERVAGVAGEEDSSRTSPAPSGPFSFSCPSPLSVPLASMMPPSIKSSSASTSSTYSGQPSAPPTTPLPVPPPAAVPGQENVLPQQAYAQPTQVSAQTQTTAQPQASAQQTGQPAQQGQQQQQQPRIPTQGIKHPNSEKARRVAQLTKLRERWRTGPKPEPDEIYICPFCTYSFIYGEEPIYLVRQYNRKRYAEIRARRERRKMLEKARMKGKKGGATQSATTATQATNTNAAAGGGQVATNNPAAQQGLEDMDGEGDGLCCTCGQKVGQHSHVVESVQTKVPARGDPGPAPPGGKVRA